MSPIPQTYDIMGGNGIHTYIWEGFVYCSNIMRKVIQREEIKRGNTQKRERMREEYTEMIKKKYNFEYFRNNIIKDQIPKELCKECEGPG